MKKVRIGVVGLGNLGELHVRHLQHKIGGSDVVAVCDIMKQRVHDIQARYDIPAGYTDYDQMLSKENLDAVVIVSNVDSHKEHILKACRRKVHIFCEKPLARHLEECREIEEAVADNAGKIFTLGYMRRFDPSYAEAKARVDAGEIGTPIMFKAISLDPVSIIDELLAKTKAGVFSYWFLEMGNHDADLARWFLGSEMVSVYSTGGAYVRKEFAEYDDYDNGFAMANYASGGCAFFHVGMTAAMCHVESEIIGTKGAIRVNAVPRKNRLQLYNGEGIVEKGISGFLERWEEAFYREMVHFVDCVGKGSQPELKVEDGTKSLEACILMQKAYLEKKLVHTESLRQETVSA